ncbi:MAG TPA: hypothetical protein ENK55_05740, partial [Actinobacteria bacterium]|nr:hypothetical protein [Actinomycetota bacterium]
MRRWTILVFVLALVAAACGGGGGGETTTTKAPEATTTTAGGGGGGEGTTTTAGGGGEMEMKTDFGVDVESKTIKIGMLPDLTGIFSSLVTDTTDAQKVYWDRVNANGGIDGWKVELVIEDTNYNVEQHLEKYEKIRNEVLFISTATGSPTNVAALPKYIEDQMVFSPLSFYSGWAIPDFDQNLALEKYTNYCIEAINVMS